MNDTLLDAARFAFVFILPIVLTVGVVLAVFSVGALFSLFEKPEELRRRIEAAFRRPAKPAGTPGPGHYYQAYWNRHASRETGED